jgi:hypothetical protein
VNLNVMFGSQTGTAMGTRPYHSTHNAHVVVARSPAARLWWWWLGFAQQLGKLARKKNIKAKVVDLEEFEPVRT